MSVGVGSSLLSEKKNKTKQNKYGSVDLTAFSLYLKMFPTVSLHFNQKSCQIIKFLMFPVNVVFCTETQFEVSFVISFRFPPFHVNMQIRIFRMQCVLPGL